MKIYYKRRNNLFYLDAKQTKEKDFHAFLEYLNLLGVQYKGNASIIKKGNYLETNNWYKNHEFLDGWCLLKETLPYIKEFNKIFKYES